MFGFDKPEDGSEDRYKQRVTNWTMVPWDGSRSSLKRARRARRLALLRHHGWWLLHNCVAHMAIGLVPVKTTFRFHDWTSRKLNAE